MIPEFSPTIDDNELRFTIKLYYIYLSSDSIISSLRLSPRYAMSFSFFFFYKRILRFYEVHPTSLTTDNRLSYFFFFFELVETK